MANQLHVAFSDIVKGAGMIACGPFESVDITSGPMSKWDEKWFYDHIKEVSQTSENITDESISRVVK